MSARVRPNSTPFGRVIWAYAAFMASVGLIVAVAVQYG